MPHPLTALRAAVLASALMACGRSGGAATMPDGSKIAILIVPAPNIAPDITPERTAQLDQLSAWMESDLIEILNDQGYAAAHASADAARPAPNRYVLHLEIKDYVSASRAGRIFDAAGTGTASLTTHLELIGSDGNVVAAGAPSTAGAPDWTKAARRVNRETAEAVNAHLRLEH